jgi:hypothetical protein
MYKVFFNVFILLFFYSQSKSQQTFEKTYQGFWGTSVEETNVGGYAVVGTGNYGGHSHF